MIGIGFLFCQDFSLLLMAQVRCVLASVSA